MDRRDFIRLCGLVGISLPFTACTAPQQSPSLQPSAKAGQSKRILIIGAGAAGLTAGHLLGQLGFNYTILECSDRIGGRMKDAIGLADFPIPLGAEWLHTSAQALSDIINEPGTTRDHRLQGYLPTDPVGHYANGELTLSNLGHEFGQPFSDKKFIHSSWLDFYSSYLAPHVQRHIQFHKRVTRIDWSSNVVRTAVADGTEYQADAIILTVPLKMLQTEALEFSPPLPSSKREAIAAAPVWGGLKMFLSFSDRFYPTFLTFSDSETSFGQRLYYDGAHGHTSDVNILGLFAVGEQAKAYQAGSDSQRRDFVLSELDQIFAGAASRSYQDHVTQDWSQELNIASAYLADECPAWIPTALATTVADKLYFAGEAYTTDGDWGGVHNAARAARRVVNDILHAYSAAP